MSQFITQKLSLYIFISRFIWRIAVESILWDNMCKIIRWMIFLWMIISWLSPIRCNERDSLCKHCTFSTVKIWNIQQSKHKRTSPCLLLLGWHIIFHCIVSCTFNISNRKTHAQTFAQPSFCMHLPLSNLTQRLQFAKDCRISRVSTLLLGTKDFTQWLFKKKTQRKQFVL